MKMLKFISSTISVLFYISSFAQSLSYEDIINIQKSNLDKVNGFFSQAGWTWNSSKKDDENFIYNGYVLVNDKTIWKNNSNEYAYLEQKDGCVNIFVYFTTNTNFNGIEDYIKTIYTKHKSGVEDNQIWTSYRGKNNIEIVFTTKKGKDYYSQTWYEIDIYNYIDINKRIEQLCSNCKGKGQIIEFKKCRYCDGDGKQNCDKCDGRGKLYCGYCKEGYTQCNSCWGNGNIKCNKCWGNGKLKCSKCYGYGTTKCSKCGGNGKIYQNINGQVGWSTCNNCGGKGKFTCTDCSGVGSLTCENCTGSGTLTCSTCRGTGKIICQSCKGNYSTTCAKCGGTGNTDLICSNCNGKGTTKEEIKKVCSVCNGNKLKAATYLNENINLLTPQEKLNSITDEFKRRDSIAIAKENLRELDSIANATSDFKFDVIEYNFGAITQGKIINYDFNFSYFGNTPLVISKTECLCACCSVSYLHNRTIDHWEKGVIKVTFDSTGQQGLKDWKIKIFSNVKNSPIILHVKGTINLP